MQQSVIEKLTVAQLTKNALLFFMEPDVSLLCSQEPATALYPQSHESSYTLSLRFLNIQPSIIFSGAQVFSGCSTTILIAFIISPVRST
jgi:hypothetical protein